MEKRRFGAWVAAILCCAGPVLAQSTIAPTATGETGLFTITSGQNAPAHAWTFGLYYNNWDRVIDLPGTDDEDDLNYDWNQISASVGYGITDRFELSLSLPYIDYNGHGPFADAFDFDESGIGNARVNAKWMFTGDENGGAGLNLFAYAPTSDGDVAPDDPGFGISFNWNNPNLFFSVGYQNPGDNDEFDTPEQLFAGLGYVIHINDHFHWINEINGTFQNGGEPGADYLNDSVDFTTGGRMNIGGGPWAFNFALRTDLMQLSNIDEYCPIGGLVGITYLPGFMRAEPPPPPPAPAPAGSFSSLISLMIASVVSSRLLMLAAFCRADRSTLVGTMTPILIRSPYSWVRAL